MPGDTPIAPMPGDAPIAPMPGDTPVAPMPKGVDFLACLPRELVLDILVQFKVDEWRQLRLVSKYWNRLFRKSVWYRVFVGPYQELIKKENKPAGRRFADLSGYFGRLMVAGHHRRQRPIISFQTYTVISYETLMAQAKTPLFREAIEDIGELYIMYRGADFQNRRSGEYPFAGMAELFKHVPRVWINFCGGPRDNCFLAFQSMLNQWKPTTEFYLGIYLNHPKGSKKGAFIDINGMKIAGLYLFDDHGPFQKKNQMDRVLPLAKIQGTRIKLSQLHSLTQAIITLTVEAYESQFQVLSIPDTVTYLEITNIGTAKFPPKSRLKIPSGVELVFVDDLSVDQITKDGSLTCLSYLDFSVASRLKWFRHKGMVSSNLVRAINQSQGSLEVLGLEFDLSDYSVTNLSDMAQAAREIRYLQLAITALNFPWVNIGRYIVGVDVPGRLSLPVRYSNGKVVKREYPDSKIVSLPVEVFVDFCQKLGQMELLLPDGNCGAAVDEMPWLKPSGEVRGYKAYKVDIPKARNVVKDILME